MLNSRSHGEPAAVPAHPLLFQAVRIAALVGCLLGCGAVLAGSFSVTPVRVYMQARERAVAITVTNEGDTPLVMQAEVFEWKQKPDSTDELTPTDDVAMAPPVLKLAPKARQVLRLANLRPVVPGQQLTYRLLVREIPEALPPAPGAQVQVALAFSIPIFITPPEARQRLSCSISGKTPEALSLACQNLGQAYAQPVSFSLATSAGETLGAENVTGGYILPGVTRSFKINRAGNADIAGPAKLTVTQDDGSKLGFDVVLP